jgi:hypothetical protein
MASIDTLRKADFHRNAMKSLAMSQNQEIRQVANAVLDAMLWLDSNYTDLKDLFGRVSSLETELKTAKNEVESLRRLLRQQ